MDLWHIRIGTTSVFGQVRVYGWTRKSRIKSVVEQLSFITWVSYSLSSVSQRRNASRISSRMFEEGPKSFACLVIVGSISWGYHIFDILLVRFSKFALNEVFNFPVARILLGV